jgi:uncharacterized membrane-anchored protein
VTKELRLIRFTAVCALVFALSTFVSATTMTVFICSIIRPIWTTLATIAPLFVGGMFMYGASKYIYSAEDPGGRKQGKEMCIHALIGAIMLVLVRVIVGASMLNLTAKIAQCGITIT